MNNRRLLSYAMIIIVAVSSLVFPNSVFASTSQNEQLMEDQPRISFQETSTSTIEFLVYFPENPLISKEDGKVFDENLYSHPSDTGAPDLPVLRKNIEVPFASGWEVEMLESVSYTAKLGEAGLPSSIPNREPEVAKCVEGQDCDEIDKMTTSNSKGVYPASPVQLVNTYIMRGHQIAQLQFFPVQYNQADGIVTIFQEMTIRITQKGEALQISSQNSAAYSSPAFENLINDHVINYNQNRQAQSQRDKGDEGMLIIAPDAFLSTLSELVDLKQSQGYATTLVGLSQTGSTPQEIKSYIQNAYQSWIVPPTFVMLVGDVQNGNLSLPAFTGESSQSVTDLYYGTVDGTDWIPDIFVGRMPARSITQLETMIDNLVAYDNLNGTEAWIKKASFLASNDTNFWDVAEATQNYVIENHTLPRGYSGVYPSVPQSGGDKLFAYTFKAGNPNVIDSINDKRSLISYTGHGSHSGWGGPLYDQNNVKNIDHTGVFSVVTSFACVTGDFNATESFGETWLLQPNKGAVAFIGSSSSSYWGPDDTLERAMMDSLYSGAEDANIVSYFLYEGLMAVEAERPGTGTAQSLYYWEIYNLLGDPTLASIIDYKTPEEYNPVLSTSSVSTGQAPGQQVVVKVDLTNAGMNADSYEVNLTSGAWSVELRSKNAIELSPGESTTIEMTFFVPEDAEFGEIEQYNLIVTSQFDPESPPAEDHATIEIKVSSLSFIPYLIKN